MAKYKLHETELVTESGSITRRAVVGGWIYYTQAAGLCFVPDPNVEIEDEEELKKDPRRTRHLHRSD